MNKVKSRMVFCLFLVLVMVPFVALAASDTKPGAIHVRVLDQKDLSPVVEAVIIVMKQDREAYTDERGEVHFGDIPPGTYRLEIRKSAYVPLIKADVIVISKRIAFVDVRLEAADSGQLEPESKDGSL